MKYTKPPLTISDQIKILESRGLIIADKAKAEKYLSNISYYRLSAYMYPFKDLVTGEFAEGTTFENVLNSYLFDRELRLLIFDAIERIEIAFRTQLIYQPAMIGGAFWFRDASNFDDIARMHEHSTNSNQRSSVRAKSSSNISNQNTMKMKFRPFGYRLKFSRSACFPNFIKISNYLRPPKKPSPNISA